MELERRPDQDWLRVKWLASGAERGGAELKFCHTTISISLLFPVSPSYFLTLFTAFGHGSLVENFGTMILL